MIGKDCVTCCRPPAGRIRKFAHGRIRKFAHGSRCRIEYPLNGRRPLFTEHCHHCGLPQAVRRVGARVPSHERTKGRRRAFLGKFSKSHASFLLVIRETSKPATVRVGGALEINRVHGSFLPPVGPDARREIGEREDLRVVHESHGSYMGDLEDPFNLSPFRRATQNCDLDRLSNGVVLSVVVSLGVTHRSSFPLTVRRIPPRPVHLTTKVVLLGASI